MLEEGRPPCVPTGHFTLHAVSLSAPAPSLPFISPSQSSTSRTLPALGCPRPSQRQRRTPPAAHRPHPADFRVFRECNLQAHGTHYKVIKKNCALHGTNEMLSVWQQRLAQRHGTHAWRQVRSRTRLSHLERHCNRVRQPIR